MSLTLISGPALEAVTLAEAKHYLRLGDPAEDVLVQSLIVTSRAHIEAALGLALVTQSWRLAIDRWPDDGIVEVAIAPLRSVTAIRARMIGASPVTLPLAGFAIDTGLRPARIALRPGAIPLTTEPISGLEIDLVAGFGDQPADVPPPIRHALLLLVSHWYENREPALVGHPSTRIPLSVSDLLQPYRQVRL